MAATSTIHWGIALQGVPGYSVIQSSGPVTTTKHTPGLVGTSYPVITIIFVKLLPFGDCFFFIKDYRL